MTVGARFPSLPFHFFPLPSFPPPFPSFSYSPPLSHFPPLSASLPPSLVHTLYPLNPGRRWSRTALNPGDLGSTVSLYSGTQKVSQLIAKGLNQTPACKNWLILLFQKIDITKFPWGRLGGIGPTTFWPWGRSPPSSQWNRRLCMQLLTPTCTSNRKLSVSRKRETFVGSLRSPHKQSKSDWW